MRARGGRGPPVLPDSDRETREAQATRPPPGVATIVLQSPNAASKQGKRRAGPVCARRGRRARAPPNNGNGNSNNPISAANLVSEACVDRRLRADVLYKETLRHQTGPRTLRGGAHAHVQLGKANLASFKLEIDEPRLGCPYSQKMTADGTWILEAKAQGAGGGGTHACTMLRRRSYPGKASSEAPAPRCGTRPEGPDCTRYSLSIARKQWRQQCAWDAA